MLRKLFSGMVPVLLLIGVLTLAFYIQSVRFHNAFLVTASTNVGGQVNSNTTWTEANSPYIVTSSVLVSQGITLTIEPGVVVKFESAKAMQVDGQLIARGNEIKPIVFTSIKDDAYGGDTNGDGSLTSPTSGDWAYIFFTDTSIDATFDAGGSYVGGSILEYCVVKYGGSSGARGTIRIDLSAPFLNHIAVSSNANSGIYISQGTPRITSSNVSHNGLVVGMYESAGIYVYNYPSGGDVTIVGNTITNNFGYGIYAYYPYSGTGIISNNIITNNGKAGVFVSGGGGLCEITNNLISFNSGGGIRTERKSLITNNIITHNSAADYMGMNVGGGMFVSSGYNQTITNNIIAYNTASEGGALYRTSWGSGILTVSDNSIIANTAKNSIVYIYCSNDTFQYNLLTKNTGRSNSSSLKVDGLPTINYNNLFNNTYSYEIHNTNPAGLSHVDAKNNWWSTSNETEIQVKIYDWFDDASKGIVDYAPYSMSIRADTPISPPTNLKISAEGADLTLNWNANPEPDLAGYQIYYDIDSGYPYKYSIDVGNVTKYTLKGLPSNITYFTVTAYDAEADENNDLFEGHESWYASETMAMKAGIVPIIWNGSIYPVALSSNSTILMLQFNQPQKQMSFNVTGASGTIGFCNITIPKSLLNDSPWTITVDGYPIDFFSTSNNTHSFLYFTYMHASTHQVIIQGTWAVSELPPAIVMPLFMALTMLAVFFTKKKFPRKLDS